MAAEQFDACYETFNEESVAKKTSHKTARRKYYPSNKSNSLIRNAQTGERYSIRVGSIAQLDLYKIVDLTSTCDEEGYIITSRNAPTNPNPNHLYYDSPEQCMSHLRIVIDAADITRWRNRQRSNMYCCSESECDEGVANDM